MGIPGVPGSGGRGGQKAASRPAPVASGASGAPEIEPWGDYASLPSLLLIGGSGTGKTDGIAKLIDAGFNVVVVVVEDKMAALSTRKPGRINICAPDPATNALPTPQVRWKRLQGFSDKLRAGGYREVGGKQVDLIAIDGLMEVSDLIAQNMLASVSSDKTIKAWSQVAIKTVDFFKTIRDAAGEAAARLGGKPIGMVATCGEGDKKRVNIAAGDGGGTITESNVPLLEGNKAKLALPFQFEVIWRLSAGAIIPGGAHQFHVHTQATSEFFAKSPAGLFEPVESGPGGLGNDPDIGVMYRKMLETEGSPYYQGGGAK